LEVVIAIAVLSIGIVFILQAFSFSARVAGLAVDIVGASFITQDKMQELEFKAKNNILAQGSKQDKQDKFEYKYTVVDLDPLKLYEANFDIDWHRAGRAQKISANTYLTKP
jgi:hypothetical protein